MKTFRRSLVIVGLLFNSFLNSGSVDVRSSYAAEQPSPVPTSAALPAPKKKTTVTEAGYPPIELLAATDFEFYARAPCCPQFDTRFNMTLRNSYLYLSDSSDTPIQKISTLTGEITPLAMWTGSPVTAVPHGDSIIWIEYTDTAVIGGRKPRLNRTSLDGVTTTMLADGFHDTNNGGSFEILVDDTSGYWVNAANVQRCLPSGSCYLALDWLIQKVPLAGGPSVTLATVQNKITAIARDDLYLYWTENPGVYHQQFLKRVPLVGGVIETVVDGQLNGASANGWAPAANIVVAGGEIFFGAYSGIMKVAVSGGAVTVLQPLTYDGSLPRKIAVDETNVYWLDSTSINRVPRGGGSSSVLLSSLLFPAGDFMIHNGNVIWSDNADRHVMTGRINTMPVSGGQVTTLVNGLEGIRSFARDDSMLYFVDGGYVDSYAYRGRIAKLSWNGGPATTIASAVMADYLSPITADDVNVYFGDYTGIKKVSIDGGVVDTLSVFGMAFDIATDGSYVYWLTENPFPIVNRVPVNGGTTEMIAPPRNPSGDAGARLVLAGGYLYWYEHRTWPPDDAIMRVPISGGPAETVVSGLAQIVDMAVDGTNIFFQEANAFNKISVNGGAITNIGGADDGSRIALDDTYVYWGNYFGLQRAPKSGGIATTLGGGGVYVLTADNQGIYWLDAYDNLLLKIDHGSMDRFVNVYNPGFDNIWPIGSKQSIMWGFKNAPGTVKIDISRDGGATWSSLIKKGAANRGFLSWKVKGPQSDQSHIRVCISNQSSTMCDTSSPFTIQ